MSLFIKSRWERSALILVALSSCVSASADPTPDPALQAPARSASTALSAATVRAKRVVKTEAGVFWQPVSPQNVVFFVPKTKTVISEVAGLPSFRRAALAFVPRQVQDPAELDPDWAGRVFRPFILSPDSDCTLYTQPYIRWSRQEVSASNRELSAADTLPICQYRLLLAQNAPLDELEALAESGGLIDSPIALTLSVEPIVLWARLHALLAERGELEGGAEISNADALELIDTVIASDDELEAAVAHASEAARAELPSEALAALFEAGSAGGVTLAGAAPAGGFGAEELDVEL